MHFLEHYPSQIKKYGPLVNCYTLRFEAKHNYFKRIVHRAMNFKNILLTLSKRHQLLQTYYLSMPQFLRPVTQLKCVTPCIVDVLCADAILAIDNRFGAMRDNLQQATCVTVNGQEYSIGMFITHGSDPPLPEFCKIQVIILESNSIYFLCQHYTCTENLHLKCYELRKTIALHILELSDAIDFLPLHAYFLSGKLCILPKHYIYFPH